MSWLLVSGAMLSGVQFKDMFKIIERYTIMNILIRRRKNPRKYLTSVQKSRIFKKNERGNKMNNHIELPEKAERKRKILGEAVDAFRKETNLNAEIVFPPALMGWQKIDAALRLEAEGRTIDYWVEVKPTLNDAVVGRLAHYFKENPGRWLVVTRHAPDHLARKMRDLKIQFMDTVGNAYINQPPFLIFMHGNRPPREMFRVAEKGVFRRAGLKVVFVLLCKRELEGAPYREIADAAYVALGTVGTVLKDLVRQGFMLDKGKHGRALTNKKELLDRWTAAYAEWLRPKGLIGRYATDRPGFWPETDLRGYGAQWGGETAASRLTHYLRPEIITIYARRPVNDLVLDFKLHREREGKIEIRERFWKLEAERNMVPPILVYADLLATTDTRNVETARIIYDRFIQRHLGEG